MPELDLNLDKRKDLPPCLLESHLTKMDDAVRMARTKSQKNNGATICIPITAHQKQIAMLNVQCSPEQSIYTAKVWVELPGQELISHR